MKPDTGVTLPTVFGKNVTQYGTRIDHRNGHPPTSPTAAILSALIGSMGIFKRSLSALPRAKKWLNGHSSPITEEGVGIPAAERQPLLVSAGGTWLLPPFPYTPGTPRCSFQLAPWQFLELLRFSANEVAHFMVIGSVSVEGVYDRSCRGVACSCKALHPCGASLARGLSYRPCRHTDRM